MARVAEECGAEVIPEPWIRDCFATHLAPDTAKLAVENYRVRRVYMSALAPKSRVLVWDDVDGLFLNEPVRMKRAIAEHPDEVSCVRFPCPAPLAAAAVWVDLGLLRPSGYIEMQKRFACSGTHVAPVSMMRDRLDTLQEYHRRLWREPDWVAAGLPIQQGQWQGVVAMHGAVRDVSPIHWQIDCLKLQYRPEIYHACTEKLAGWFWEAFLQGYEKYLENPQDGFAGCPWL